MEQIAAFCAEYPIEPKILFVPSRQVGANLLTALARSGCDWINLEPLTPANHAEQETAPQLKTSGLKSLHTDTAHIMVTELLRSIKARPGNYFEPVSVTPSLSRSVWETLRGMRLAGVDAGMLKARSIAPEKAEALQFLLTGFEKALEERGLFDDARLMQVALQEPSVTQTPVAIMEELTLTALDLQYVRSKFEGPVHLIGRAEYGLTPPSRSARVLIGKPEMEDANVGIAGGIRLGLLSPSDRDDVVVWGARGPESEIGDIEGLAI
ncbi:MAG: hypothetical protein ACC655_03510, partial [Rhodothermia bacterium]